MAAPLFAALLLAAPPVAGVAHPSIMADGDWTGRVVLAKQPDTPLMAGVIRIGAFSEDAVVEGDDGDAVRLRVRQHGRTIVGRASKAGLVPLSAAVAFCTGEASARPDDPRPLLLRAAAHDLLHQPEQAAADFDAAVRLKPSVELLVRRGDRWHKVGDDGKALADYDAATRLAERSPLPWKARAQLHAEAAALAKNSAPDKLTVMWAAVVADSDKALHLDAGDPATRARRGAARLRLGRIADALEDLDAALATADRSAWAFVARAELRLSQDRAQEGLDDCAAALRLDQDCLPALLVRAWIFDVADQLELAQLACGEILRRQSGNARAHAIRARVRHRLRDDDGARTDLQEAARLEPADVYAHCVKGLVDLDGDRFPSALACFDDAIALDPSWEPARIGRGMTLEKLGRPADAADSFAAAHRLWPQSAVPLVHRHRVLRSAGRKAEAAADIAEAIALMRQHRAEQPQEGLNLDLSPSFELSGGAPTNDHRTPSRNADMVTASAPASDSTTASACRTAAPAKPVTMLTYELAGGLIAHGQCVADLGDADGALPDFDEAVRLVPDSALFLQCRARALIQGDHSDVALKDLERAEALAPGHWDNVRLRARAYHGMADTENAELELQKLNSASKLKVDEVRLLADVWTRLKRYDDALRAYDTALQWAPSHVETLLERVRLRLKRKEWDKAVDDCNIILKADAKSAEALNLRGLAWNGQQHFDLGLFDIARGACLDRRCLLDSGIGGWRWTWRVHSHYLEFGLTFDSDDPITGFVAPLIVFGVKNAKGPYFYVKERLAEAMRSALDRRGR